MPNRSIVKTMLEDALLVSVSQPGGRKIKLQYNIFTNIMTRLVSRVKNIGYK